MTGRSLAKNIIAYITAAERVKSSAIISMPKDRPILTSKLFLLKLIDSCVLFVVNEVESMKDK